MENALYSFYSLVVLYHKTHSFAALTRSFYDTSRLVNKNRTRALSMKYSLYVTQQLELQVYKISRKVSISRINLLENLQTNLKTSQNVANKF